MAPGDGLRKIAILGGGVSGLAAAMRLTEDPEWKTKYEVTLYQMGWRLGGKCASGRSGPGNRIEEHGIHIWLGFYENAFRMIQQAYEQNYSSTPPTCPIRTWDQAFKPHSFICLTENIADQWKVWPIEFPVNTGVPGSGGDVPTMLEFIEMMVQWLAEIFGQSKAAGHALTPTEHKSHGAFLDAVSGFFRGIGHEVEEGGLNIGAHVLVLLRAAIEAAHKAADLTPFGCVVRDLRQHFMTWLWSKAEPTLDVDDELRRLFLIMDTGFTTITGLFMEGVVSDPADLDKLEEEYLLWLKKWGAFDICTNIKTSPIARGLYDLVFAYENGDTSKPSFAAGPAIRSIFKMVFCYKGAIFWKMQAGTADATVTPIYSVLKQRGVKFQFFHKVLNLGLSADKSALETILLEEQVELKNPAQEYYPMFDPQGNGLLCWPSQPLYEQIKNGDALKGYDLESFWTTWKGTQKTLTLGEEFDEIVLCISLGSMPYICPELVTAFPDSWGKMVTTMQTVRTQAYQAWMSAGLKDLGWQKASPVLDAFAEPMDTWADMSQVLPRETWPTMPASVQYFCSAMPGGIPPQSDSTFPAEAKAAVQANAAEFTKDSLPVLWPDYKQSDVLSEYFRANIDPSERYVLSVAGSTGARLRANESGVGNLFLAGDWINNGFNAGCVEASVMSGFQAANAAMGRDMKENILEATIMNRPG